MKTLKSLSKVLYKKRLRKQWIILGKRAEKTLYVQPRGWCTAVPQHMAGCASAHGHPHSRAWLGLELGKPDPTREHDTNPTRSYWERHEPDLNQTDFDPKSTRIDRLAYKYVIFHFKANLSYFKADTKLTRLLSRSTWTRPIYQL